jgi:hypothetical protein
MNRSGVVIPDRLTETPASPGRSSKFLLVIRGPGACHVVPPGMWRRTISSSGSWSCVIAALDSGVHPQVARCRWMIRGAPGPGRTANCPGPGCPDVPRSCGLRGAIRTGCTSLTRGRLGAHCGADATGPGRTRCTASTRVSVVCRTAGEPAELYPSTQALQHGHLGHTTLSAGRLPTGNTVPQVLFWK